VKTHKGVHAQLHRLTKDDAGFDDDLRGFLSQTYDLKAAADYETGPGAEISPEQASAAVQAARRFVAYFETMLGKRPSAAETGTA
jgi:uncharacterized protein (UPF0332 family)